MACTKAAWQVRGIGTTSERRASPPEHERPCVCGVDQSCISVCSVAYGESDGWVLMVVKVQRRRRCVGSVRAVWVVSVYSPSGGSVVGSRWRVYSMSTRVLCFMLCGGKVGRWDGVGRWEGGTVWEGGKVGRCGKVGPTITDVDLRPIHTVVVCGSGISGAVALQEHRNGVVYCYSTTCAIRARHIPCTPGTPNARLRSPCRPGSTEREAPPPA